jgi:membrane-bound serine protease (ClpP class)
MYARLVSTSASGTASISAQVERQAALVGRVGVTLSPLRPSGKAQFDDEIADVMSQGDMIGSGRRIRVVGHSGAALVVEAIEPG